MSKFTKGDYVVYPGHGVGRIRHVEVKEILGTKHEFYGIDILDTGMKILCPKNTCDQVGLRPVMNETTANKVAKILNAPLSMNIPNTTWNRRYREYMEMIKNGNPIEIAQVYHTLKSLKGLQELSFGERKMLDCAFALLTRELRIVSGTYKGVI